ncbi:MAG: DUF5106 domain-containing protein [Parabacteroides sp.]
MRYFWILFFSLWMAGSMAQKADPPFPMVSIPSELRDPADRASYLAAHYWDRFDFADTTVLDATSSTEQALCNFIDLMRLVSPQEAEAAFEELIRRSAVNRTTFDYFLRQCEDYLYGADSPVRNENWLIPVLRTALSLPLWNEYERIRPASLLALLERNRVGEQAEDFSYTLAEGQEGRLYQLQADYLLLYFLDPTCDHCQALTRQLRGDAMIRTLLQEGRLKLLALYPGEEPEVWKKHLSEWPESWIRAYDASQQIVGEELYDLQSYPVLYLLDREKRVLLKEATYEQVVTRLGQETE